MKYKGLLVVILFFVGSVVKAQDWSQEILAGNIVGAWTRTGDVDGDSDPDIFVQHGDTLFWYENLRPGWTRHIIDPLFLNSAYSWLEDVDMDLDGDPDLLHAIFLNPGVIAWNENRSNGAEWVRHVITPSGRGNGVFQKSIGDIDGDGDMDAVFPEISASQVSWFEATSDSTIWIRHSVGSLASVIWTTVADIDADSDADVVAGSFSPGGLHWFENHFPDTTWTDHFIANLPGSLVGEVSDIDGDGNPEVITHNGSSLVSYESPSWNVTILGDGFSGLQLGRLGDVDGDDDIDVTYGGDGFGAIGDIGWAENPGTVGVWLRHNIDDSSFLLRSPTGLADIDGDGDTDIVGYTFSVSTAIGDALWYSNPAIPSSVAQEVDDRFPETFSLAQNYPNPFNPVTTIRYGLPEKSLVRLEVFDVAGQRVAFLVDGERDAGYHDVKFNAESLPSGIYFYRLLAGEFVETKKLILMK